MNEIASVFGIEWKLLLVQIINFGILLFILQRFLYKPLLKMIDERRKVVEKGVLDAKLAKETLEKSEMESNAIQNEAKDKARELLSASKTEGIKLKEQILKDAELEKERVLKEAEVLAKRMEEESLRKSKEAISRFSILAAERILKEKH